MVKAVSGWAHGIRIGIGIMVLVLLAGGAGAATLTVDDSGGTDYTKIHDAYQMPGRLEANGTHFELKNSSYLNITLDSSEPVNLTLESAPFMVTMHIESASGAAQITLGGFAPQTTYHKYEDNYHNHTAFTTDIDGKYTYTQDLSNRHLVFIQPRPSTRFINDDATGGDCTSIGTWNSITKTCTLTFDLTETIQIDSNSITFDGNGHTISGSNTGNGVYLSGRNGVTIKNLNVKQFSNGIYLYSSSNNMLSGNNASSNNNGISLSSSNNNTLSGNYASNQNIGIILDSSNGTILSGNNISNNVVGIIMSYSANNIIYNNFFNNTYNAAFLHYVNYWNITKTPGTNIIGGSYLGGNVWATPQGTGFSQNCADADTDGICDSSYTLNSNNTDYLPLVYQPTGPDITKPSLTFTAQTPVNGSILGQKWVVVSIISNESLSEALLEWNGANESMIGHGTSLSKRKVSLANGTHSFKVWGSDYSGNWNSTEVRAITIAAPLSDRSVGGGAGNGSIASGAMSWNASNFPAFWHEDGISGETLAVLQPDLSSSQRVIYEDNLVYNTTKQIVVYKAITETGLTIDRGLDASDYKVYSGGYYAKVGWLGKPYVAVNGKARKLSKLLLEQNSNDSKNLAVNEIWSMGDGYSLKLQSTDTNGIARQAWLVLSNRSGEIDNKIIQEGGVYTYVAKSFAEESDVPLFVTYADNISANSVRLKFTWLISDNVTIIEAGDAFGIMKVIWTDDNGFELRNKDSTVALSRNTMINLLDGLYLAVLDNPALEYYPIMVGQAQVKGDVNRNGRRDTGDATLILRYIVGLPIPTEFLPILPRGDMNCNSRIDTGDATLVLRDVVGLPIPKCWE